MLTALLVVIFISFIGIGLPDSVLGVAWPAIYTEFGLPISLAGYISATVSVGTIISSLLSARLIAKFGTGTVTAVSTALTAFALLGFTVSSNPYFFFILAIPMGLGAGSIDTALNSFVAQHYSAAKMSFLHCFYGIGVAASPFIMSLALGEDDNWRRGYLIVTILQFVITVITFISMPLWGRIEKRDKEENTITRQRALTIGQTIRIPGVAFSCFAFFGACALELTAGGWSSSYFVNTKGLEKGRAAMITMLFYIGLAVGRFLSGVLASRLGRRRILRLSLYILPVALLFFALPLPLAFSAVALFLIGLGIGPVFPNLVHLTPKAFGEDVTESVIGIQQAMTYIGVMLMPWLFGVLAGAISTKILPVYLILMFAIYLVSMVFLLRKINENKAAANDDNKTSNL